MSRAIRRTWQARRDVIEAADYIAETSLNASDRFLQATETAFKILADMPGIGALRDYDNPNYAGMRMSPVPGFRKYLVFYLTHEEDIEIIRVLHGARDLTRIFAPEQEAE